MVAPRFLQLYNQELVHVRDSASEFAQRFPKIASRLALDSTEVQDPYVERLLQGFAFLTARVQLRLEEEFPEFTSQLLNRLNPNALAPMPSMGVVQFHPNIQDPALLQGLCVPAGTVLQSNLSKGMQTPCKFTVAHQTQLSACTVSSVRHSFFNDNSQGGHGVKVKSALLMALQAPPGVCVSAMPRQALQLYFAGVDSVANPLFDRVAFQHVRVLCRAQGEERWRALPPGALQVKGLGDEEALLPIVPQAISSMRLLQEWFAMPARCRFVDVLGVQEVLCASTGPAFELAICFSDSSTVLDQQVGVDNVLLNCAPVINLFPHLCDRVVLGSAQSAWPVLPNRTRPLDFEVHTPTAIRGHAQKGVQTIAPLFAPAAWAVDPEHAAQAQASLFYTTHRYPTRMSARQRQEGARSSYLGSELEISLSEPAGVLASEHGLSQLEVHALCSNRDLPLLMPLGLGDTDLLCPSGLPVQAVRFVHGPTKPRLPPTAQSAGGHVNWQLVQHLAGNFLGLISGHGAGQCPGGAPALKHWLGLHADPSNAAHMAILEAVHSVQVDGIAQPLMRQGRPALVRGLHVQIKVDEHQLQGVGMGAFAFVLAHVFARHVSLNSFVQTTAQGLHTGEVFCFAPRCGHRPLL